MTELRQREGDQQLPIAVDESVPIAHELAKQALDARLQLGIQRYGQPLRAFNGRDALRDATEEALDLVAYISQAQYEAESPEHTYVGDILRALYAHLYPDIDEIVIEFGEHFVPQGVYSLLDRLEINYTLPVKRTE